MEEKPDCTVTNRTRYLYFAPTANTRLELTLGAYIEFGLLEGVYVTLEAYCKYIVEEFKGEQLREYRETQTKSGSQGGSLTLLSANNQRLTYSMFEITMRGLFFNRRKMKQILKRFMPNQTW